MSEIKYSYPVINAAVSGMHSFCTDMDSILDDVGGVVSKRAAASGGDMAAAFTSAQADWNKAAAKIKTTLGQVAAKLEDGSNNMNATDRKWANSFE